MNGLPVNGTRDQNHLIPSILQDMVDMDYGYTGHKPATLSLYRERIANNYGTTSQVIKN